MRADRSELALKDKGAPLVSARGLVTAWPRQQTGRRKNARARPLVERRRAKLELTVYASCWGIEIKHLQGGYDGETGNEKSST